MNYKMTVFIIGKMLGVEGVLLLLPAMVAFLYGEKSGLTFLLVGAILFGVYLLFGRKAPKNKTVYGREGLVIVGSAWVLWSFFGALPFFLSGSIPNYLDAFFEAVSGFTTTGATILTNIEGMPHGMLFWRSLTQWIGGIGVLLFMMLLTSLGDGNTMLSMPAEILEPQADKPLPKARRTAKLLCTMYFALTAAEVVFLLFGGMSLYDALIHALGTAGTGGFSNRNSGIAFYDSAYIDGVITIFMILFGVNFNLYFLIRFKDWKAALKNEELRVYLGIMIGAIAIISVNILGLYGNIVHAFRHASFQAAAIISTTGFCTANYDLWPELSKVVLLGLMVIGACAGSTGGGIKVARLLILVKSVKQEIRRMLHPKSVTGVRLNGRMISRDTTQSVYIYFVCYILTIMASVLLISLNNYDFTTTFSSVLTTLNNVGPGLALAGPAENFSHFTALSKMVFCLDMLIGRLGIFPYLLLLSPDLWRRRF